MHTSFQIMIESIPSDMLTIIIYIYNIEIIEKAPGEPGASSCMEESEKSLFI